MSVLGALFLHLFEDLHTVGDFTENDVLIVEVREGVEAHEELGAVGSWASVSHREVTATDMLVVPVLVGELVSVDGLTAGSVAAGEVSALGHEAGDDSVESATLEVEGLALATDSLLSSAESSEVLGGDGSVTVEGHCDSASGLGVNADIKEDVCVG